jgi:hypothetical protein
MEDPMYVVGTAAERGLLTRLLLLSAVPPP